ncbi:MAG: DNA mismatch repair protein MutS [Verrucomicrobiota bacterium]|nr:DNA mismatch repair protein MutS [Verrucomicrobiota bacterium]
MTTRDITGNGAGALTPMMRQYRRIRKELAPEVILFFRLGDFYEMFFEDAQEAAPILDVALTKRQGAPMCGVPHHAVDAYLARLIKAGKKVAICDQTEDPATARGIVRREVTRIVTPGTVTEDKILQSSRNNFLAGVYRDGGVFGLAMLDLSTGLFFGEVLSGAAALRDSLRRLPPSECVAPESQAEDPEICSVLADLGIARASRCDDWVFAYDAAHESLRRHFGAHSLAGFGCEDQPALVGAAGGILHYVRDELKRHVAHIRSFHTRSTADYLVLDEATCGNLDLAPLRGQEGGMTLLRVLDVTRTAMGARAMRDWLLRPLARVEAIRRRQDTVEALAKNRAALQGLRDALAGIRDLERLIARIGSGSGNARDAAALGVSLAGVPAVKEQAAALGADLARELDRAIVPQPELADLIRRAIVDEPPIAIKEGGLIRAGYNADLDELRTIAGEARDWLAKHQDAEQRRTGIKTIKVRHNRVFGYYIEVSKGQLPRVPENYVRKQTLVNAERFITPELKEHENKILGAQDRAQQLEYDLFVAVREAIARQTPSIQAAAQALGQLDALAALADRALALGYVRPAIGDDGVIRIRGGRHPVVEQMPEAERFVPNDTLLDNESNQLLVITGPNMAGKSTHIRQVALIVVMAQMGSFVPADEASIGLVDRVFTRVGASDDLARGRSTFMVEMQETANILNNATRHSLIVLDEIGCGTSTFDGISIAWAVAEFLHNNERVKAKTLFATHYHELTDLALTLPGVKNYNVLVREKDDQVVFLRKIAPGGADKSYGIQVARLAGLPPDVVDRAKEILANLEEDELGETGQPKIARRRARRPKDDASRQLMLFGE